jgi:hypothetical protein
MTVQSTREYKADPKNRDPHAIENRATEGGATRTHGSACEIPRLANEGARLRGT